MLDGVRKQYETTVPCLEVFANHGSEFVPPHQEERPHGALDWDSMETPPETFERLLPVPAGDLDEEALLATEVSTDE